MSVFHNVIELEKGEGFKMQMEQFQEERLFFCKYISFMDNCIDYTIDYCNERKAFGKKIIDNQVIQFRLSELKTEVELLRSLIYRACEHFIQGEDVTLFSPMAKLKSGRLIREVADTCVQYYGGMGFTWENQAQNYIEMVGSIQLVEELMRLCLELFLNI